MATSSQIALQKEVWRGPISLVDIDQTNPNWVVIESAIPAAAGGFIVREVGLFDEEGKLLAVGKYPETYKPIADQGSSKDLYIRMVIEVSNAASITLKIDPTVIIASRKYVDDKIAVSIGPVNQSLQQIKGSLAEHLTQIASSTMLGHVKVGQNLTITSDGILNAEGGTIPDASTTVKGIVQLSDTVSSTSATKAATANAVRTVQNNVNAHETKRMFTV